MRTGELIIFDVETTGTDRRRDQVIELCVQLGLDDDAPRRVWRVQPTVPISPEAQAVHGISMEDLAGCPRFAAVADEVREVFDAARILVGYNLAFDIGMLQAEFARLGQAFDLRGKDIVDAFRLWQQCEPRSLQHAHERFVGDSFAAAHSAAADVAATGRVLQGMIESFDLAGREWGDIASVCEPERASWIGPSHHIRWSPEGRAVLGFGKHAGQLMDVLARSDDSGYLRWIMDKDFPPHVREICAKALELPAEELTRWVQATYGVTASVASPEPAALGQEAASSTAPAEPAASQRTPAEPAAGVPDASEPATSKPGAAEPAAAEPVATGAATSRSGARRRGAKKKAYSLTLELPGLTPPGRP